MLKATFLFTFIIILATLPIKGAAMEKRTDYESIIRNKTKNINLKDGVNKQEAILVAQRELLDSSYKDKYDVMKPIVNYDKGTKTWGIQFEPKNSQTDENYWGVLIKKDTGEIYSGPLKDL